MATDKTFGQIGNELDPKPDFNYNKVVDASQEDNWASTWGNVDKKTKTKKG